MAKRDTLCSNWQQPIQQQLYLLEQKQDEVINLLQLYCDSYADNAQARFQRARSPAAYMAIQLSYYYPRLEQKMREILLENPDFQEAVHATTCAKSQSKNVKTILLMKTKPAIQAKKCYPSSQKKHHP